MEAFQKLVIVSFPRLVSPRIPRTVCMAGPYVVHSTALGIRAKPKSGIVRETGDFSGVEIIAKY